MTEMDQNALIGKLVRGEKAQAEKYALLAANARAVGEKLESVGSLLKSNPAALFFEGQSVMASKYQTPPFTDSDLSTPEAIRQMVEEVRKVAAEWKSQQEQLSRLGFPVPVRQ